ncbi:type 1 fimbrial protein [Citrobacter koseri]|uniref:type 1 fimbrial protein n=1 Tax=Citrobacter koseri TaxID=545 RepID=UPI000E006060|nr:type 1 fimbrial protein [Citrobacter koseri]STB73306.1 P pilus assembly protein, pilin FimA [Citrobacter koseri]STT23485.1 P pilus assembly protein, pilin FimA [Citrobacter koseri]
MSERMDGRRTCLCGMATLAVCVVLWAGEAGAAAMLTVKGSLIQGSCAVTLVTGPTLDLGGHIPAEFTGNNGTAAIGNIRLRMDDCNDIDPDKGQAGVVVSGVSTLTGSTSIFNDNPAGDAGFMLRENGAGEQVWSGSLNTFYDDTAAVKNGAFTLGGAGDPTVPGGILLNYGVGFVAKTTTTTPSPSATPVTANLTFTFDYR